MRILLVSDTYLPSVNGAAYFTSRLATALAGHGHDVAVMAPSRSAHDDLSDCDGIRLYGIRSIPIPYYPNLRATPLLFARRSIRRAIISASPDIIHVQNHFMIGRGAVDVGRGLGIPLIGTNHFLPETITTLFNLPSPLHRLLIAKLWSQFAGVYNKLDFVTAPSQEAVRLTQGSGVKVPVTRVSNGIDISRFSMEAAGSIRRKYGLPPAPCPVLLFVGRLDPEKRLNILLLAMQQVLQHREAQLVIAGVGKHRAALERLVSRLQISRYVTFTGFVPDSDVIGLYRTADVFLMPGEYEMQSIATLEAMASGLPVIAANSAALPELVTPDDNGFLYPPGDWRELARLTTLLLDNLSLAHEMGQRSRELVCSHELGNVVARFEALYAQVISNSAGCYQPVN